MPDPNSYAALGARLHEIAMRVVEHLQPEEITFLQHLTGVDLPAADEVIQAATFASLTVAQEALAARRQVEDVRNRCTEQHQRIVELQGRLALFGTTCSTCGTTIRCEECGAEVGR